MGIKVVEKHTPKYKGTPKKRQRTYSVGESLFRLVALICAAALLLSSVSAFINPEVLSLPMFFGLYYTPIVVINLIILIIALVKHKRSLLIPVVALIPTFLYADRFIKFGTQEQDFETDGLKVMTYNVGRYNAGRRKISSNESVLSIKRFIEKQDPDVVCLQEFLARDSSLIHTYLPKYPYSSHYFFKGKSYFGNVTLSKYPIVGSQVIKFPESTNLCLTSDININGNKVRFYNCHLESYSISFSRLLQRIAGKDPADEVAQFHGKLREANVRRAEQVKMILESESQSDIPTFVCGDFNDTPVSYTYQRLHSTKKDSFTEAGTGLSGTYSILWPLLTIDYILLPTEYSAGGHEIHRIPYSDHYPVSTTIYFEE